MQAFIRCIRQIYTPKSYKLLVLPFSHMSCFLSMHFYLWIPAIALNWCRSGEHIGTGKSYYSLSHTQTHTKMPSNGSVYMCEWTHEKRFSQNLQLQRIYVMNTKRTSATFQLHWCVCVCVCLNESVGFVITIHVLCSSHRLKCITIPLIAKFQSSRRLHLFSRANISSMRF